MCTECISTFQKQRSYPEMPRFVGCVCSWLKKDVVFSQIQTTLLSPTEGHTTSPRWHCLLNNRRSVCCGSHKNSARLTSSIFCNNWLSLLIPSATTLS